MYQFDGSFKPRPAETTISASVRGVFPCINLRSSNLILGSGILRSNTLESIGFFFLNSSSFFSYFLLNYFFSLLLFRLFFCLSFSL